jgi:hypothetical protein
MKGVKWGKVLKVIGFLLMTLPPSWAQAQTWSFELWHDGKIVLESGDTLRGFVKYDLQQDLVQYSLHDKKPEVYSARKVMFFEIFDETEHTYRRFFALPYGSSAGYKAPVFFELLEEGELTLLSREQLEYKTYSSPYITGTATRLVLINKYFFLNEAGTIDAFTGGRNDLIGLMGKNGKQVEKYIKKNRLRYDDKRDLSQIIAYYNSLSGGGS